MNTKTASYLAGIIDGEGCVHIGPYSERRKNGGRRYRLSLTVANTSQGLMEWLRLNVGGVYHAQKYTNPKWKPAWRWSLAGREAQRVLELVYPYLVIKRDQANVAFAFPFGSVQTGRTGSAVELQEQQARCHLEMKRLNRKGQVV